MMTKEERKAYDIRYRAIHRDKIRFQKRAYYEAHIVEIRTKERNRQRMKRERKLKEELKDN